MAQLDLLPHDSSAARAGYRSAEKSPSAFRTISEVSDELGIPQHVLRFWEHKFEQISPLKRRGGRRYYRPEDVDIIRQIKALLYEEGYTIKGAVKHFERDVASHDETASEEAGAPRVSANTRKVLEALLKDLHALKAEIEPA